MENFIFECPTRIIFGRGTETLVGEETQKYSRRVLLHYGSGSIKKSGLYKKVLDSLQQFDIEVFELSGVQPNPRLSLVYEGIRLCREQNINFVLAVGGGSVIDSAKAIAIGVPYSGDVWDFYIGKAEVTESLPVGVILTLPASGSEASTGSVISNEKGWYKRPVDHHVLRPKFSILNPELTFTLSPFQTACGVVDIFSHVMERYFTNVSGVDFTDRLCEATIKTIIENAPKVMRDPENYDARAEIMWAGTIAHNDLLGTGRIADWGSHHIEHELSALFDVAHGVGLSVVIPAWMSYVYEKNMDKFVQFAMQVWNVQSDNERPELVARAGINHLREFFQHIGLPVSLGEININADQIGKMAEKATENGPIGNLQKLTSQDVVNILRLAL